MPEDWRYQSHRPQLALQLFRVASHVRFPEFDLCMKFEHRPGEMIVRKRFRFLPPVVGSYRFCSLRHASNGFFRELATMSLASQLVRAMSAVCIWCRTSSRFCTPRFAFVSFGRNSRSMAVVVISVVCSAAHSNIISDSLITPPKNASVFFDHC